MSIRPTASIASVTMRSMSAVSVMSAVTANSVRPSAANSSTTARLRSALRAAMTTEAPASASPRANALPSPWLAPVTRAVRPVRSNGLLMSLLRRWFSVIVLMLIIGVVRPAGDGHALHPGQLDELGDEVPDGEAAVEPDVHDDQLLVLGLPAAAVLDGAGESGRGRDGEDLPQHSGAVGVGDPCEPFAVRVWQLPDQRSHDEQRDQVHRRECDPEREHPGAAGHAHGGADPDRRRGGQAAHHRAALEDHARAEEADAGDDLGGDA